MSTLRMDMLRPLDGLKEREARPSASLGVPGEPKPKREFIRHAFKGTHSGRHT